MTDSHNYHINIKYVFATFNFYRTTTTASIRFAQFHLDAFQTIYPTLFIAQNAYGIVEQTQFNAFFFSVVDFFLTSRHFIFTTTVNDINVFSTKSFSSTSSVHRHVTCTNDGSLLACVNRSCYFGELVSLHQVYTCQEFVCRIYTIEVFAVNLHKVRQTSTSTNINCIETFFFHQFFNGKGATDYSINYNLYAQIFQCFDFVLYDFLRQTELGNAIHQYATSIVQCFVQSYFVTKFCQIACSSQTGRTAAYDSHFLTFGSNISNFNSIKTILTSVVSYETFQTTNSNRFAFDTKHTFTFALVFLRANATANCRQAILAFQDFNCFSEVFFSNCFDKFRNFYVYRTAFYTTRFRAVQAALCFIHCHFFSITKSYFFKVFITDISRLFRHGISHSSTHLQ